jgi:CHAD domain-containing protein
MMRDHLITDPELRADELTVALGHGGFELGAAVAVTTTVLDTFDGRLHGAGLRLELRRASALELVLLDGSGAPPASVPVEAAPQMAGDLPAGPLAARLAALTKERALLPLLSVRSRVRSGHHRDKRDKATVHVRLHTNLERVGHPATTTLLPAWAAEVTGTAGHDAAFEQALGRLIARGIAPVPGDLVGLVAQVSGVDLRGRSSSPTVPLDPTEPAPEAYRRVLVNLADTVEANLLGTIDDVDPEFLHELRVAVRRTRSVLSQAKGVLPDDVRNRYRTGFGWLGAITGPARDLDVYLLEWDDYIAPLRATAPEPLAAVRAEIERRAKAAHVKLAKALQSNRYEDLVAGWEAWLRQPTERPDDAEPVGPVVAARIAKAQRRLLSQGRAITPLSPPEDLHDLRKDAKKLRYLLECFGSLLPTKPRKVFVQQLKALQDNLGAHQDAEVHVAQLRSLADDLHGRTTTDAGVLLAMGQLTEVLEQRRIAERADFAERFAAYDTDRTERALEELLEGARGPS